MLSLVLLIIFVVLGSAFFSGIEAALFSVPQSKVILFHEKNKPGSRALLAVKENLQRAIMVIVIGNNIVNIVGSIFVGVLASRVFGDAIIGIVSAILTILIILFGEIFPKTIGENYSDTISLRIAPFILFLTKLLSPIVWIIEKFTSPFIRKINTVSEDEIHVLSEIGHREGSIEKDEKDLIHRVFTLNDLVAKDIMTPRTVISAFPKDAIIGEIEEEIFQLNNSRIPVYENSIDSVIGVCYRKQLLIALAQGEKEKRIEEFLHDILFVSENMRVDDLLQLFLSRREHIAIVKDEFDGTSGLVTLEDVLEQLVGEIVDEDDEVVDMRVHAQHEAEKRSED